MSVSAKYVSAVSCRVMLESGESWKLHVYQMIRFHEKFAKSSNVMSSGNARTGGDKPCETRTYCE